MTMFHVKMCSKCLTNERVLHQRWCAECRKQWLREWRWKKRAKIAEFKSDYRSMENAIARLRRKAA